MSEINKWRHHTHHAPKSFIDRLDDVVEGRRFSESTLHEAANHPLATGEDIGSCEKFVKGCADHTDTFQLRSLVVRIAYQAKHGG